jgi:hypothetical protein
VKAWWRRNEEEPRPTAADEAIEISERRRARAVQRRGEFERIAKRMRKMREVNHLAEAFERAFGEGRR